MKLWTLFTILLLVVLFNSPIFGNRRRERTSIPAISKVWVINMNKRSSRLLTVANTLRRLRIPFHRYGAIDFGNGDPDKIQLAKRKFHPMTQMNVSLVAEEIRNLSRPDLNWGSTGCWQSHLQIYLNIMNGSASHLPGPFVIFEDDVNVSSRVIDLLSFEYLYKYLPYDWEMLFLDHLDLKCHQDVPHWKRPRDNRPDRQYCMVRFTYQTDAYVIRNPDVAAKLVHYGNTDHVQVADWYFNELFKNKTVKAYAILKKPVSQLRGLFGTDIQTDSLDKLLNKS